MSLVFPSSEFDRVVAGVCHGTASELEMQALNGLLRKDVAAMDEYLIRVEMHSRLASSPDLFAGLMKTVERAGILEINPPLNFRHANSRAPKFNIFSSQPLALAACVALVAVGAWALWQHQFAKKNAARGDTIALLARSVDARWNHGGQSPQVGAALEAGWLHLESGLAQVVFTSGARVVLEGPAELHLISPMQAYSSAGRLLAEVPESAHGFRLLTPRLDVVDLGTSFGVDAAHGRTELHVFKGKVEFSAGNGASRQLTAGNAEAVQGEAAPQPIPANSDTFASLIDLQEMALTADAVRYDHWRMDNARLSRDPALVIHFDLESFNASANPPTVALKSQSPQSAIFIGSQQVEGRWPEKHAVQFQGANDRVLLPAPGNFDSLTLAAWVRVQSLDRQFNSLFMCDGFEAGAIHWLIRKDGALGLSLKSAASGKVDIIATTPVLTSAKLGTWIHLAVVIDGKRGQVTHYLDGLPVASKSLTVGPPFRIGAAELGNWNAESGSDPSPSLIRNLDGALDEFELFSRAFTDAEVRELYTEGKPKSEI